MRLPYSRNSLSKDLNSESTDRSGKFQAYQKFAEKRDASEALEFFDALEVLKTHEDNYIRNLHHLYVTFILTEGEKAVNISGRSRDQAIDIISEVLEETQKKSCCCNFFSTPTATEEQKEKISAVLERIKGEVLTRASDLLNEYNTQL